MVLLSKTAIQKVGSAEYVRVYIPTEVVQKLGINGNNPYIMWIQLGNSFLIKPVSKFDAEEMYNKYKDKSKEIRDLEVLENELKLTRERCINSEYNDEWTEEFKEAVRERDNYKCQICGMDELPEVAFDVHHINDDKENPEADVITLCPYCHKLTRTRNREYYKKKLLDILRQRDLIGWSKIYLESKYHVSD